MKNQQTFAAGEFKAKCLDLMDQVAQNQQEIIITKRGKPVAKLVPYQIQELNFYGRLKGSARIQGDIINALLETWDAEK